MTQKASEDIIRLAGTACCPSRTIPSRKNRRLPGTISGNRGVRHLAGTVFADTTFALKY